VKLYPILVDPEFRSLIPPMSAEERLQLKANIREHGLLDKIMVWGTPEGFVIVDGHHRYEILKELAQEEEEPDFDADEAFNTLKGEVNKAGWWNIVYGHETFRLERFEDREAVKLWILEHQVGRRNLTKEQRISMVARIVLLRQEQTAETSKANLKQGSESLTAIPDVTETVPSGKRTVAAAAKEFDVPREPLQNAVNKAKGKPAAAKKADPKTKTPSPVATAPAILSEMFYVIRRKLDGKFLFNKGWTKWSPFIPEPYEVGGWDGVQYFGAGDIGPNDSQMAQYDSGKKTIIVPRDEWDWVKVEAQYKLTPVKHQAPASDPKRTAALDRAYILRNTHLCLPPSGRKRGRKSKFTTEDIARVKIMAVGATQKAIAKEYGVSPATISKVLAKAVPAEAA
jgi:hypothetical protein